MLQSKRVRALRLGADGVVDAATPDATAQIRAELGEGADVVFDCVAIQPTVDQVVQLALKAGFVMIVGVPSRPVTVLLPEIQDLQVRIQGSATYQPDDYATATEIIQAGKVRVEDIITARFPSTKLRPRSPPPPEEKRSRSSSSPTRRLSNTDDHDRLQASRR